MSDRPADMKNRTSRRIDFDSWARKALWYPLEAAALSLSVDPDYFRLVSGEELRSIEEFERIRERIDLIERLLTARIRGLSTEDVLMSTPMHWAEVYRHRVQKIAADTKKYAPHPLGENSPHR
jgi:hypothetical protein